MRKRTNRPHKQNESDAAFMLHAMRLAHRGEGFVEPNPMVGCVVVRGGRVIGQGWHRRFGCAHAEVDALRRCAGDPSGSTLYVSLEPCCRQGKTPPCTDALIEAGVARVVVGCLDPNPAVNGRGVAKLRRAGCRVDVGVCGQQAQELVQPFAVKMLCDRPYVIAKWAQSIDGKVATRRGDSKWISSQPSRRRVHGLRARVDAILVGSQTVLMDNPLLTARDVRVRRVATRVVLDGRLRISPTCRIVTTAHKVPTLVFTSSTNAGCAKARRLSSRGVEVIACRTKGGRLSPAHCLAQLARQGMTNVLIEGGPTLMTSFFDAKLVDEAWVFVAPYLIGGAESPSPILGRGANRIDQAVTPIATRTTRSGCDLWYKMRLTEHPGA